VVAGCGAPTPMPQAGPAPTGSWAPAAAWPQANWSGVLSGWTGREVVVLGGGHEYDYGSLGGPIREHTAGPGAAAYDPASGAWRAISRPPFPLLDSSLAVLGGTVYAHVVMARAGGDLVKPARHGALHSWSPERNAWHRLPPPPNVDGRPVWGRLVAAGNTLVVAGSRLRYDEEDQVEPVVLSYDPADGTWSRLPAMPLQVVGEFSTVLGLPEGRLVAVGAPPYPDGVGGFEDPPPPPRFWQAAVLDPGAGSWRELPPSPIPVGERDRRGEWVVAGGLVVNAADGGRPVRDKLSHTPRGVARDAIRDALPTVPTGIALDVDSGTWSFLPERPPSGRTPTQQADMDWADASGGDLVVLDGWAYDARRRTWAELPPVPSAPLGLWGSPVLAWTGERLFAWAYLKAVAAPGGTRHLVDKVGWAWTPP
jgi:hypothetical protein